jgi:hypothetical protein
MSLFWRERNLWRRQVGVVGLASEQTGAGSPTCALWSVCNNAMSWRWH